MHEPFPEQPALLFDLLFPSGSEPLLLNLGIADAHGLTPMFAGLGTQKNAVPSLCDPSLHASRAYRIPAAAALEAVVVGKPSVRPNDRRRVLRLPDLDHCKTTVFNRLGSPPSPSRRNHRVGAIPRAVRSDSMNDTTAKGKTEPRRWRSQGQQKVFPWHSLRE